MKLNIRFLVAPLIAISLAASLQGCVTRLDDGQIQQLDVYEKKGLAVHERNEGVAGVLGVLPMTGYAYSGRYALAVFTIPLYPFAGPLWMPFDAAAAAKKRNYYATVAQVGRDQSKEKKLNDQALVDKKITYEQHMQAERAIEDKYAAF